MSFSNIQDDIRPPISTGQDDTINLLLASIAFEEIELANIIHTETEKIQSVLGKLNGQVESNTSPSIGDLIGLNIAVEKMLRDVINKEMLLQLKLENILEASAIDNI